MDGWITIGTELSTKKFDKQVADLENKMQKEEKKKIVIDAQITNIEKEKENFRKLKEEAESYQKSIDYIRKKQQESLAKGGKPKELSEEGQRIVDRYNELQAILYKNESKIEKLTQKENNLKLKQQEINDKVSEYKKKIESVKIQKQKAEIDGFKKSIDNVGNSLRKSVINAGKLALGIFGIRSAYMMLQRASSELASYDEQYATNIDYIKFALNSIIAPALRYIVNLAGQLLSYVNAIANAWFGINLFGKASIADFQNMKKGANGVAGAVKEIKKEIAGFDELNVLNDSSSSGGGVGSAVTPDFDLSLLDMELPEWLQWIIDNGDLVAKIVEAVATALLAVKLGLDLVQGAGLFLVIDGIRELVEDIQDFVQNPSMGKLGEIFQDIGEILVGFSLIAGLSTSLGQVLAVAGQIISVIGGIINYIEKINKFLEKPSLASFIEMWRGAIKTLGIVGVILDELLDKLGLFNFLLENSEIITKLLVGTMETILPSLGLFGTALDTILRLTGVYNAMLQEEKYSIKSTTEATEDLTKATNDLKEATDEATSAQEMYINSVDRAEKAQNALTEAQNKTGLSGKTLYEEVEKGTLDYKDMTAEQREVYKAYLDTKSSEEKLQNATTKLNEATIKLTDAKKKEKMASLENQLALSNEEGKFDEYKNAVVDAFNKGEISSDEARELIGKSLGQISKDGRKTFIEDLPTSIKNGLDVNNYETDMNRLDNMFSNEFSNFGYELGNGMSDGINSALVSGVNGALELIESRINYVISRINSFTSDLNNNIPFFNIPWISYINLPRLKTGGIINMPNQGTLVGSAIAGESGREGVLPLTDSQTMAELGREIGKWITINANITNTMNGRVISRELKQIQNEQSFAYNI